jgi:hypothetical protein
MDADLLKNKLLSLRRLRDLQESEKTKKAKKAPVKKSSTKKTGTTAWTKATTVKSQKKKSKDKKAKPKKSNTPAKSTGLDSDDNTTRKWEDYKIKENLKKGQFTDEESQIVLKALCEYAYDNDLQESDLINLVTERQTKEKAVWCKVSECLPDRSVQSVHNFCHRVLNPYNYKGAWTSSEEKKLIE